MNSEVKDVTIHYLSGRDERLGKTEALAALSRQEWMEGKQNLVLLVDKKDPFLQIYRNGQGFIFKHPQGITEFASMEELKKDKYWETIYEVYTKM